MTRRTRSIAMMAVLALSVALAAGVAVYNAGWIRGLLAPRSGPDELRFIPVEALLVASADVEDIMASPLREKISAAVRRHGDGQGQFAELTGINIETDITRVVAAVTPLGGSPGPGPGSGLLLARGRFDEVKIEALMRDRGAHVEEYRSSRLILATPANGRALAVAFLKPGLLAFGAATAVRAAVDAGEGAPSVVGNDDLINMVRGLDPGQAWVVGRFDALAAWAGLPPAINEALPAGVRFSASARVEAGIGGVFRVRTTDEAAANDLREVIRGALALTSFQAGSRPEFRAALKSFQLGGSGTTVALSFDIPGEVVDLLGSVGNSTRP